VLTRIEASRTLGLFSVMRCWRGGARGGPVRGRNGSGFHTTSEHRNGVSRCNRIRNDPGARSRPQYLRAIKPSGQQGQQRDGQ
jgi:hypothetical protein